MTPFCCDLDNSPLLTDSASEISALVDQYINNILKSLLDQLAPEKSRTVTSRRTVPWFTDDIAIAKRKRCKGDGVPANLKRTTNVLLNNVLLLMSW